MIAFVDSSWRVHVAGSDGNEPRRIEGPGTQHTWPIWSPVGDRLLFSCLSTGSNGGGILGLYLHAMEEEAPGLIYANEPGTDAIASRTPHYALWSPDGGQVAFLAGTWQGGLTLFVSRLQDGKPARKILEGSPLFMSWSPDSRFLLAHRGPDHHLVDFRDGDSIAGVPGSSSSYMAPSWSPDSNRLALMSQRGGERQDLLIGEIGGGGVKRVAEFDGSGAFSWSPDGGTIGLVRDQHPRSRFYRGLWLVAADGSGERRVTEDPVLCFYWSPTGGEIAYVTLAEGSESAVRWALLDAQGGPTRYLANFRPTEEQLAAFLFFDQYGQSHNPWSPDGSKLLFSGVLTRETDRAVLPQGEEAGVLVAATDGAREPESVARGVFACWSPR